MRYLAGVGEAALESARKVGAGIELSWDTMRMSVAAADDVLLDSVVRRHTHHFAIQRTLGGQADIVCLIAPDMVYRLGATRSPLVSMVDIGTVGAGQRSAILEDGSSTVVVLQSGGRGADTLVTRMLRAIAFSHLFSRGWTPLHASSVVASSGDALVLLGPKASGKTTLLLSLLQAGCGALLSNDTLFVAGDQVAEARALPVSLGIRTGVLRYFPELTRLVAEAGRIHIDNTGMVTAPERRIYAPPEVVAKAFTARRARSGNVVAFVRVALGPPFGNPRLRKATAGEARSILTHARLHTRPDWAAEWLYLADKATRGTGPDDGLGAIADLPCYTLDAGVEKRMEAVAMLQAILHREIS